MSVNTGPTATNSVANSYVRELAFVADVHNEDGLVDCTFRVPTAPTTAVVVGQPHTVGVATQSEWGQNITVTAGTDEAIVVHGYDYLGQPMQEGLTVSTGTATGAKAFKWVSGITGTVADQTLAWGDEYGLPYMAKSAAAETLTAADQTTPTATTGDPRGTVNFDVDPLGTDDKSFSYTPFTKQADGITTMHGARHFTQ